MRWPKPPADAQLRLRHDTHGTLGDATQPFHNLTAGKHRHPETRTHKLLTVAYHSTTANKTITAATSRQAASSFAAQRPSRQSPYPPPAHAALSNRGPPTGPKTWIAHAIQNCSSQCRVVAPHTVVSKSPTFPAWYHTAACHRTRSDRERRDVRKVTTPPHNIPVCFRVCRTNTCRTTPSLHGGHRNTHQPRCGLTLPSWPGAAQSRSFSS